MSTFNKFRVSKNLFDDGAIEFYFKIQDDEGHVICDFCVSEDGLYYYRRKSLVLSPKEHKGTVGSWDGFLSFEKLDQLFKKLEETGCSFRDGNDSPLSIKEEGSRIILSTVQMNDKSLAHLRNTDKATEAVGQKIYENSAKITDFYDIGLSRRQDRIKQNWKEWRLGVKGPYRLEFIADYVEPGYMGVYMLGRYTNYVHYVGRSDSDLIWEIRHAAFYRGRRYVYFWFEYTSSPMRAYKRECELWHKHGGEFGRLDNQNHPAKPWYANWKCPIEDCPYWQIP